MKVHLLVDFNKNRVFGCFLNRELCIRHQDDASRAWIQTDHIQSSIEDGEILFSGDFKNEVRLFILLDSDNEQVRGVFFEESNAKKRQNELINVGDKIILENEKIVDGLNLFSNK